MNRRRFLKLSLLTPLYIQYSLRGEVEAGKTPEKRNSGYFEFLEVSGSYREIGYRIGKRFGRNIHTIIRRRKEWHRQLMRFADTRRGKALSDELMRLTRKHFPQFLEELSGMAEGAGMDFKALWVMSVKSELGALEKENPGCSTIFYQSPRAMWLFHNEDGHVAYRDQMFLLKVHPPSGVSFLSLVYPGILTGNGPSLNSRGIIQTTNYIGSVKASVGIPRYVIGRAILEAESLKEAQQIATMQPRAYPYHHNIASIREQRYLSVETTPALFQVKEPHGIYYHTNHLLFEKTPNYPHENLSYKNSSSMSRYTVLQKMLEKIAPQENLLPEDFLAVLSSHENAPYSPCRHPQGEVKGQTLGTAFFDVSKGVLRLYRGNPCQAVPEHFYRDFKF